jgi:hypothetical protein
MALLLNAFECQYFHPAHCLKTHWKTQYRDFELWMDL